MKTTIQKHDDKGELRQSEVQKATMQDVILRKALLAEHGYCVMPLNDRHTNFFKSLTVAKAYAEDLAKQSFGQVIIRGTL